jgi:putative RNA 2'-phosphotransferase
MNTPEQKSKFLSFILRHKPEAANLSLDREGWCFIAQLISNTDITLAELLEIVATDGKKRYSISADGAKIRANQGHTTSKVKLSFKKAIPPIVLYHGTDKRNQAIIEKEGLKAMKRHHVHLSADVDTALSVGGRRRGFATIFIVDCKAMVTAGIEFFLSENDVWLTDYVDPKYLTVETQ